MGMRVKDEVLLQYQGETTAERARNGRKADEEDRCRRSGLCPPLLIGWKINYESGCTRARGKFDEMPARRQTNEGSCALFEMSRKAGTTGASKIYTPSGNDAISFMTCHSPQHHHQFRLLP